MNNFLKKIQKKYLQEKRNLSQKNLLRSPKSNYFGEIGSTSLEDIPYDLQLTIKRESIIELFSNIQFDWNIYEFFPSPKEFEYRFKMEYVASFNPKVSPYSFFGQRSKKKFNVVIDMQNDILIPFNHFDKIRNLYNFLQQSLKILNFDLVKKTGNLRYIVYRGYKNSIMAVIVSVEFLSKDVINQIKNNFSNVFSSIVFVRNSNIYNDSTDGEVYDYINKDFIQVDIKEKLFEVKHNNFFQNNIEVFNLIVDFIEKFLNSSVKVNKKHSRLLDLFCGIGTFGILLHNFFNEVIFVENNVNNVEQIYKNCLLNDIKNFIVKNQDLYKIDSIFFNSDDFVVLDPPRSGLGKKLIDKLISIKPFHLIYLSCNPQTQYEDILLLQNYYSIVDMKGFDMFPNTFHCENCIILKRK